jgi:hypothetical protein
MKISIWQFALVLGVTAALAAAQGPGGPAGPGGPGNGPGTKAGLNMAKQQVVEGTISTVQIAYGAQYPSIVVNKTQIKVAPVWYLLENDFELSVGESVKVLVAPSNTANDPYLYAIEIAKSPSGEKIMLRNGAGVPLWIAVARRGGSPQAPRTGGGCVDPASIKTVSGTIESVTGGVGIQHPTLALKVDNALLTLELGPERMLLDADLELRPGATLRVKYALATCTDEYVALQLTDAAGNTLLLRHDDGTPAWND